MVLQDAFNAVHHSCSIIAVSHRELRIGSSYKLKLTTREEFHLSNSVHNTNMGHGRTLKCSSRLKYKFMYRTQANNKINMHFKKKKRGIFTADSTSP